MKLASYLYQGRKSYGIATDKGMIDLGRHLGKRYPDLKALLAGNALSQAQELAALPADLDFADIYIIAVTDDAIGLISSQLPFENRMVVHTSGSVSMEAIDAKNRQGVFYPLQTFSKNKPVDFTNIPICIETQHESDDDLLEKTARSISRQLFPINSYSFSAPP